MHARDDEDRARLDRNLGNLHELMLLDHSDI